MRPRTVNNQSVNPLVPHGRLAEKLPEILFGIGAVFRQPFDENFRHFIINFRVRVRVFPVIRKGLTDILFSMFDNLLHFHNAYLLNIPSLM